MSQQPRLTEAGPARPTLAMAQPAPRPMPPAPVATWRRRHWTLLALGAVWIAAPTLLAILYLWVWASDRYISTLGFSVRTEEASSPLEMLGNLGSLGNSSSSDMDILYAYLDSQTLVEDIGGHAALAPLYHDPAQDPIFDLKPGASIEDVTAHWRLMSTRVYDAGTGLMELEVAAFSAADAQEIARRALAAMRALVDDLSRLAAEDVTRDARENVERAQSRLAQARAAVDAFRTQHQIVDPGAPLQTRSGVLSALEGELAQTLIDGDILRTTTRADDPRVAQVQRRVAAIRTRIADEKARMASSQDAVDQTPLTQVVGQFERLLVDRSFAEEAYLAARTAHDLALVDARRQTRYLAVHIPPTLAEAASYPRKWVWLLTTSLAASLSWMLLCLCLYALRDRQ
ncbi:MAG: capsule biosynthesis protein [Pseudomonadota bacterium]